MTGQFIYSKDLKEVYGDQLPLVHDNSSAPGAFINLSTIEKQQVKVLHKQGPYATVTTLHKNGSYVKFVVEHKLIKTEEIVPFYDQVKPILESMFPGKYYIDRDSRSIFLLYDKLTIKNSANTTHTIYDLLIRLYFDNLDIGKFALFYGVRLSMSAEEMSVGYAHSHLPRRAYQEFTTFCLGGGTPFSTFIASINRLLTPEEFQVTLLQLKSYLEWESLEGGPHVGLSNVKSSREISSNSYSGGNLTYTPSFERMIKYFLEQLVENSQYHPLLVKVGKITVFDITKNITAGYEFEKKVITPYLIDNWYNGESNYTVTYNETKNCYVQPVNNNNSFSLPSLTSEVLRIVKNLDVKRRIIREEQDTNVQQDVTVRRVGTNNLTIITNAINSVLARAYKIK